MSIEALGVLVAALAIIVTLLLFAATVVNGNLKTLWLAHNDFKDKVTEDYVKKEYLQEHVSSTYLLLDQKLSSVKVEVETLQAKLDGLNALSPELLRVLAELNDRLKER